MKKHLIKLWIPLLFAAALFALPMTAQAEASGECGDNLTWVLDDEGTLTISGTGEMWCYFNSFSETELLWFDQHQPSKSRHTY